VTCHNRTR